MMMITIPAGRKCLAHRRNAPKDSDVISVNMITSWCSLAEPLWGDAVSRKFYSNPATWSEPLLKELEVRIDLPSLYSEAGLSAMESDGWLGRGAGGYTCRTH
jgi:hypothetical protein